ncbi:hypothetical protein NQ266_27775, partial [Escherichia coli]|nr:hypothetical protein [Escherichia coli]
LVFLATGAELDIARLLNGGPVIHGVSSPDLAGTLAADKPEKLPPSTPNPAREGLLFAREIDRFFEAAGLSSAEAS